MLSTRVRSLPDVDGFRQLRSLILVDCGITQLPLDGLDCLETLDVRRNHLRVVPVSIGQCRRLRTVRLNNNVLRQLPSELGQLESLTTFDCAFNRLKQLTTHLVRCTQLRCLQVCSYYTLVQSVTQRNQYVNYMHFVVARLVTYFNYPILRLTPPLQGTSANSHTNLATRM